MKTSLEDSPMLQRVLTPFAVMMLLFGTQIVQGGDDRPAFRAGVAIVDITPREFPISMLGSLGDRKATRAHDPLHVRALVLDDGRTRIAIALCDNCATPRDLPDRAKQLACQRTGIPAETLL